MAPRSPPASSPRASLVPLGLLGFRVHEARRSAPATPAAERPRPSRCARCRRSSTHSTSRMASRSSLIRLRSPRCSNGRGSRATCSRPRPTFASRLEVREALRSLLLANNGVEVMASALAPLERAARAANLAARFGADGVRAARRGRARSRRRPWAARGDRPGRARRRLAHAPEGLPPGRLPLGLLRPLAQPRLDVVRDVRLRQPDEDARLPSPPRPSWRRAGGPTARGLPRSPAERHEPAS